MTDAHLKANHAELTGGQNMPDCATCRYCVHATQAATVCSYNPPSRSGNKFSLPDCGRRPQVFPGEFCHNWAPTEKGEK